MTHLLLLPNEVEELMRHVSEAPYKHAEPIVRLITRRVNQQFQQQREQQQAAQPALAAIDGSANTEEGPMPKPGMPLAGHQLPRRVHAEEPPAA